MPRPKAISALEAERVLIGTGGNVSEAARELQVTRKTIQARVRESDRLKAVLTSARIQSLVRESS